MSPWLINAIAFLGAYFAMEFVAWSNHKYIMHGFGWFLHKSHHEQRHGRFEWNDVYFIVYASMSMVFFYLGWEHFDYRFWIGAGIASYGLTYFILHDIFIHNRIKLFRRTRWRYFEAMRRAHKMHHKHMHKEDGEEFGMLIFNPKYYKILDAQNLLKKSHKE
jgi:beta-carotene 3-hydroxylase